MLRRCAEADAHEAAVRAGRGTCSVCGKENVRVLKNGTIGLHNWRKGGLYGDGRSNRCDGWGKKPKGDSDAS